MLWNSFQHVKAYISRRNTWHKNVENSLRYLKIFQLFKTSSIMIKTHLEYIHQKMYSCFNFLRIACQLYEKNWSDINRPRTALTDDTIDKRSNQARVKVGMKLSSYAKYITFTSFIWLLKSLSLSISLFQIMVLS